MASNSYNNTTKENIQFNEEPIVEYSNFVVGANDNRQFPEGQINKDCEYLKLVCGLTTSDTTLTTDSYGAVCVDYEISYKDNDNNVKRLVDSFYPKYKHENNGQVDSTIISAPGMITAIRITVTNNEDISVNVSDFKVYMAANVAEVTPDDVGEKLTEYYNNGGQTSLVIPLVQTLPAISSVPDGYICRLASIS